MTNPKWEIGPVELIGGNEAWIDAINEGQEDYRYTGRVLRDGLKVCIGWQASGRMMYAETGCPYNLTPPPKKTVRVQRWMVVYSNGTTCTFSEKDEAINEAEQSGFALLEIDREVTEGEGL